MINTTTLPKLNAILILAFFILGIAQQAKASHLTGGSITWECTSAGQYKFRLTLYRDCTGAGAPTTPQTLVNNAGVTVSCSPTSVTYINSECGALPCAATPNGYIGAMERHVYVSGPITLTGTPPPAGWEFSWSSCCRPSSTNLIGQSNIYLRAFMYDFGNPSSKNNSPQFQSTTNITLCTNQNQVIQNSAFDVDGDSLFYSYAPPLANTSIGAAFATGYSSQSPFPSSSNALLNPNTGAISLNPSIQGVFNKCIKVEEWRHGKLISALFQDLPVYFKSCPPPPGLCGGLPNDAPELKLEWITGYDTLTPVFDAANNLSYYTMEVNSGVPVKFNMVGIDSNLNSNCLPQSISFFGESPILSAAPTYAGSTNCPTGMNCATISSNNTSGLFESAFNNSVQFNWTPDCANASVNSIGHSKQTFDFKFEFSDDACPYPRSVAFLVKIKVNFLTQPFILNKSKSGICVGSGDTVLLSASAGFSSYLWQNGDTTNTTVVNTPGTYSLVVTDTNGCAHVDSIPVGKIEAYTQDPRVCLVSFDESTGFNKVIWERPSKKGTASYNIYRAVSGGTPSLINTHNVNLLSEYIDSTSIPSSFAYSYFITLNDSCGAEIGTGLGAHTVSLLNATQLSANQVSLNWTHYLGGSPKRYIIYRRNNASAVFQKLDSVSIGLNSYIDSALPAGNGFGYKIGIVMDTTCSSSNKVNSESISNIVDFGSVDITEEEIQDDLVIYPNPTEGLLYLSEQVEGTFYIYNIHGELLRKGLIASTEINISDFTKGVYMIEIVNNANLPSKQFKIVKL
jgi:hypothetical protein